MTLVITPADVKLVFKYTVDDTVVQAFIDMLEARIGPCLANYPDATQKVIKTHLIAYFLSTADGSNDVTSRRAPNGAQISYGSNMSRDGLLGNDYGKVVFDIDYNGCWRGLIQSKVSIGVVGTPARSRHGNY